VRISTTRLFVESARRKTNRVRGWHDRGPLGLRGSTSYCPLNPHRCTNRRHFRQTHLDRIVGPALVEIAERDASKPAGPQSLPNLPRQALIRIEQSEKDARQIYDRDKVPYFPMNPEFSFLDTSIFRSISHIVDYVRLFAEAVLDSHLKEYLEYAPSDLLTNQSLLRSLGLDIWTLTGELWHGYGQILQSEPTLRRARYGIAVARGTIDQHPELEPWLYPDSQQWADFIRRMAEPESEMARLNERYEAAIKKTISDQIKRYQSEALARLRTKELDVQGENNSGSELAAGLAAGRPSETTNTAREGGGADPATQQSELPQNIRMPLESEGISLGRELPPEPEGAATAGSSTGNHRLFRKSGDVWELAFAGKTVHVRHSKGMKYMAHLLRSPDHEVHSTQLFMAIAGKPGTPVVPSAGEVLDPAALAQYRSRIEDLENQLYKAERNNDEGRKEAAQAELEQLQEHVISALGLGGRPRNAHDDADKIRKAVGIAIERAIASIREHHPALAEYLKLRIKRGTFLIYEGDKIDWQF
jgi:hypothetical protein